MTTLPNFVTERIEELPVGLTPISALNVERKYHPELYDWLMVGNDSKKNQEMFLKAYWDKKDKKEVLYHAKLKVNNLSPNAYLLPYTYLNKKLSTNEFFLATNDNTDAYQSLFTMEELESLLGQDLSSYELIQEESGYDNDKNGYDRDGYDRYGYDKNGYDEYGYDKYGYDKDGYDKDGYDMFGYDEYENHKYE